MGGETAPVSSSGSAPAWTASVSNEGGRSSGSDMRAMMAPGGSGRGGPAVELEDQLEPVDVVDLLAHVAEAEPARDRERADVVGRDRGPEAGHPMLTRGPVEQRPDDLGGDAGPPVRLVHAIAHLDPPVRLRRGVEPDRPDDPRHAVLAQHDRPPEPRLRLGVDGEVGDAVLEESIELV